MATRAVAANTSKAFDRVWHTGLQKLTSYENSGQIFCFLLYFLRSSWLRVVLDGKSSKNTQLLYEFLKAPFLVLHFSYYILMTFLIILSVMLLSVQMILFSTLSMIRPSDLLQQLELALELEFHLQDAVDWGRKWFVDFNTGKIELV